MMTLFLFSALAFSPLFSDVVKKSKSEVTFRKFGTFNSVQTEKISPNKKLIESNSSFKGKGLLGKAAAKTVLKAGQSSQIIDLENLTIFDVNHKKKNYTAKAITPLVSDENQDRADKAAGQEEEAESNIRIIRSEFKVKKTGETKSINNFPTEKYTISWITEWENLETGQKGTDSLFTDVWTTPLTGELDSARSQEKSFSQAYMKALGFDLDELQQSMLGSNWMALLTQMGGSGQTQSGADISGEMKKIKGYPVLTDGKYFSEREGGEEGEATSGKGAKKLLGGLAKKALKKKKDDSNLPALAYRTELMEFIPASVDNTEFMPPSGYKKK